MPKGKSVFEAKRRTDWYNAMIKNRPEWADWSEKKISNAYICGAHFVSGKHHMNFYGKKNSHSQFFSVWEKWDELFIPLACLIEAEKICWMYKI